jgi:hypothetical protein
MKLEQESFVKAKEFFEAFDNALKSKEAHEKYINKTYWKMPDRIIENYEKAMSNFGKLLP